MFRSRFDPAPRIKFRFVQKRHRRRFFTTYETLCLHFETVRRLQSDSVGVHRFATFACNMIWYPSKPGNSLLNIARLMFNTLMSGLS